MSTRRRNPKLVSGPQLGDTTFEEWFETPVFEAEPDERLEQLAVSRRAPIRLVGSTALRPRPPTVSDRRATGERDPPRDRVSGLLDRWAEREGRQCPAGRARPAEALAQVVARYLSADWFEAARAPVPPAAVVLEQAATHPTGRSSTGYRVGGKAAIEWPRP